MRVFRFMSNKEFQLFTAGCEIIGKKSFNARTESSGICFLASADFDPTEAYDFLKGIVADDVCVEFEIPDNLLTESFGVYYIGAVTEYCMPSYSIDLVSNDQIWHFR